MSCPTRLISLAPRRTSIRTSARRESPARLRHGPRPSAVGQQDTRAPPHPGQSAPAPLRQAPGPDGAPDPAPLLLARQGQDLPDRLLLRVADDPAGVDDPHVRAPPRNDAVPILDEESGHHLRVHGIFRAPQREDADGHPGFSPPGHPSTTSTPCASRYRKRSGGSVGVATMSS